MTLHAVTCRYTLLQRKIERQHNKSLLRPSQLSDVNTGPDSPGLQGRLNQLDAGDDPTSHSSPVGTALLAKKAARKQAMQSSLAASSAGNGEIQQQPDDVATDDAANDDAANDLVLDEDDLVLGDTEIGGFVDGSDDAPQDASSAYPGASLSAAPATIPELLELLSSPDVGSATRAVLELEVPYCYITSHTATHRHVPSWSWRCHDSSHPAHAS